MKNANLDYLLSRCPALPCESDSEAHGGHGKPKRSSRASCDRSELFMHRTTFLFHVYGKVRTARYRRRYPYPPYVHQ